MKLLTKTLLAAAALMIAAPTAAQPRVVPTVRLKAGAVPSKSDVPTAGRLRPTRRIAPTRGRGARPATPPVAAAPGPAAAPVAIPAAAAPVADTSAGDQNGVVPGEREFNECIKIPANRRIKVTLKQGSDLKDLVAWISSMTCKKFIVADTLRAQKVTLVSPVPITALEAYRAFLSALEVMGLTVVPTGKYLKVVQGNWAIQSPIPTFSKGQAPASDEIVTQLVQVENTDVNELLLVLNKMKSRSGDITAYKATNMLIITDNGLNVRRLVKLVQELDVPVEGEKIWVVRLKNADAEEIQKLLSQIFAQRGTNRPIPRMVRDAGGNVSGTSSEDLSASKIVADSVSNSLIIVATASAFAKIASLIKKLDVEAEGSNQRIHVYYLENADSDELSQTIAGLTGGAGVRAAAQRGRTTAARGRPTPAARPGGQASTLFEGEVQISPDKATNSLVIVASNKDFLALRRVIKMLDIPRRQVFVEASILEVTLDKGRKLGFAYHGGGKAGEGDSESLIFGAVEHSDWTSLTFNPLALMGLAVGARMATIDGSAQLLGLPTDIPAFGVMFQALQNNNNVNVLSSPHILTTDNEEAEITVGQNIPFQGAFMGGGFGNLAGATGDTSASSFASLIPSVSVQRQDVALKLKLTPHVNESDMVRLELEQEVSDIASQNFNGLGPSTSKRSAKTVVVVSDQQTVVIGGLMGNRVQETVSKVPLLGDIPILGYFFKHTSKTVQKTNLLLVLTPYVIRDQSDLRRIFQKKLEERREFIERFTTFQHDDISSDIDFRHKRGLLAEINKTGAQAEKEAVLLESARKQTEENVLEPVEMPRGMSPPSSSSELPAYDPGHTPPPEPAGEDVAPRQPPISPTRSVRLPTIR